MEIDNAVEEFINFIRVERQYSTQTITAYAKDLSELAIYIDNEKLENNIKAVDFYVVALLQHFMIKSFQNPALKGKYPL